MTDTPDVQPTPDSLDRAFQAIEQGFRSGKTYRFSTGYDDHLPGAVCDSGLRESIDKIANAKGVSAGAVMRVAAQFFVDFFNDMAGR